MHKYKYIPGSKKIRSKDICINISLCLSYNSKDFQKWDLPQYRYLLVNLGMREDKNRTVYLGKCLKLYFKAVGIHIFKESYPCLYVRIL